MNDSSREDFNSDHRPRRKSFETSIAWYEDAVAMLHSLQQNHPLVAATARRLAEILEEDITAFRAAAKLLRLERANEKEAPDASRSEHLKLLRQSVESLFEGRRSLQSERDDLKHRIQEYLILLADSPASGDAAANNGTAEADPRLQMHAKSKSGPKPKKPLGYKKHDLSEFTDGAGLTDLQQKCFSLRFEHEWTFQEIASHLGKDRSTIHEHVDAAKKRIQRAQLRLKGQARLARTDPGNVKGPR